MKRDTYPGLAPAVHLGRVLDVLIARRQFGPIHLAPPLAVSPASGLALAQHPADLEEETRF
jgi:hypothetical protein